MQTPWIQPLPLPRAPAHFIWMSSLDEKRAGTCWTSDLDVGLPRLNPGRSATPAPTAALSSAGSHGEEAREADVRLLLGKLLPAARLTLWEAVGTPLELVSLQFGDTAQPALELEPNQCAPGTLWESNIHPADRAAAAEFFHASGPAHPDKHIDYRLIVGGGDLLWVRHGLIHRTRLPDGRLRAVGIIMPIPEQKQLEWECLRISERECNRVGQELHDDLCQVLAGVAFMMHVLGERASRIAPEIGSEIRELTSQVQGATDRVRAMAHGLFPAQVSFSSLREALTQLARQSRTRFGIEFDLELPRRIPPHSPEQIVHVYRICQEAATNAVRHGGTATIRLALAVSGSLIHVVVEDRGRGFPSHATRPEGIGLHVMQYRARVLGGTIKFGHAVAAGAAVQLSYPHSNPSRQTPVPATSL